MASATGESSQIDPGKTWVRDRNVTRHPKFNVKDHPINMQRGLTVRNVISSVVDGVNKQSMELYKKKTNSSASGDPIVKLDGDKLIVKLDGKSTEISKFVPLSQPDMNLDEDGSYVLAQYATSRLCHGIGDYFCQTGSDGVNHEDNWYTIFENINRSIDLIHAIQNPPKPKQPIATNKTDEETRFFNSVIKALESSRVDKTTSDAWISWMNKWHGGGQPLSTRTRIDIREIACDKVAVYGKVRPNYGGKNDSVRLKIEYNSNTIVWNRLSDGTSITFGPYKNIVSDANDNRKLMNITDSKQNLSGELAKDDAGGLAYDAVRTLASGVNVVLFGFGNSGTGKSFSLFGQPGVPSVPSVPGVLQLILNEMKEVKLTNVFEESPGGGVKEVGETLDYDGKIINLYGKFGLVEKPTCTIDEIAEVTRFTSSLKMEKQDFNKIDRIIEYIEKLVAYRKTKHRIRATLNNWQSSRSHMYILIDVWCNTANSTIDKPTARLCVIDLGGMERPDTMLAEMRSKITKNISMDLDVKEVLLTRRFKQPDRNKPLTSGLVSTITTLVKNITTSMTPNLKVDLGLSTESLLLSEWVTGYETIVNVINDNNIIQQQDLTTKLNVLKSTTNHKKYKIARAMLYDFTCTPLGDHNSENPVRVMYPESTTWTKGPIGRTPILKPNNADNTNKDDRKYFSLIHVAALYVEGLYIVESLNQVKSYLQNKKIEVTNNVLTCPIMESITAGKKTRNIMLFTMCPPKLDADQTKFVDGGDKIIFDNDFIEPAQFVQDVCSTVLPVASDPSAV